MPRRPRPPPPDPRPTRPPTRPPTSPAADHGTAPAACATRPPTRTACHHPPPARRPRRSLPGDGEHLVRLRQPLQLDLLPVVELELARRRAQLLQQRRHQDLATPSRRGDAGREV